MSYEEIGDAYCMVRDCTQPWAVELDVSGAGYFCLCQQHNGEFADRWEVPVVVTRS